MKKIYVRSIGLALALIILTSGCTVKSSSGAVGVNENDSQINTVDGETSEKETQELVKYRSLIEKYVGNAGERYKAYDEILKWDDYYDTIACMRPADEWLDSDGKLKLPFDLEAVWNDGMTSYAYFYVPDELAVKASTGELADICLLYSPMCNMVSPTLDIEYGFEGFLKKSNALEEALRRDDFAGEFLERYMTETENIPVYYEGMGKNEYSEGYNKILMLNAIEVILSQPEAYAQLTKEQSAIFVRRVIERQKKGNQGAFFYTPVRETYESFFLSCITGEYYISGFTGECIWENNPWLEAIKAMDLTEEEQNILDKYFGGSEQS